MKKTLSALLAAALIISLCPISALADTPESGVYTGYDPVSGELSGVISPVYDSENDMYVCTIPEQYGASAYYFCAEGDTCEPGSSEPAPIRVQKTSSSNVYSISLNPAFPQQDNDRGVLQIKHADGSTTVLLIVYESTESNDDRAPIGPHEDYQPAAFEYNGRTYYLGISLGGNSQPETTSGIGSLASDVQDLRFVMGFWTKEGESGYIKEEGDTYLNQLLSAFEDGSFNIELVPTVESSNIVPELVASESNWPVSRTWRFTGDNRGTWIFRASAELKDGTKVQSQTLFTWEAYDAVIASSEDVDSVESINKWLNEQAVDFDSTTAYIVNLEAEEYSGLINVPEGINELHISGAQDGGTTLRGGIKFASGTHAISNISFVGAGRSEQYSGGEPNYAIYGNGRCGTNYYRCTFTGYYHAVHNGNGFSAFGGGEYSRFYQNNVGIYIDAADGLGGMNNYLTNATFEENHVAIELASFFVDVPPRSYVISDTLFKNNDIDVRNHSGRNFFLPGNIFYHEKSSIFDLLDFYAPEFDNCGDLRNMVYAYFRYGFFSEITRAEESSRIEIWDDEFGMSNADASSTPIPFSELDGKNITLIDTEHNDERLASFTFPAAASSGNGAAALAEDAGAEEFFDPTVEIERGEGSISITINEIPGGLAPIVTVPCGEDWDGASVSFGGAEIASEFAGGEVSFTAESGGTYVITRESAPVYVPPVSLPEAEGEPEDEPSAPDFTDVPEDSWYSSAVEYVCEAGLMEGTGAASFEPEARLTRAMFWTILARAGGETVSGSGWSEAAREWSLAAGISDGTDANGVITREQLVTMLWRWFGEPTAAGTLDAYRDAAEVSSWARAAMAWAIENGVITGVGGATLDPRGTATRAQCAAILMRSL